MDTGSTSNAPSRTGGAWLADAERADVDEAKALRLMAQYPSLIKRPVLDTGAALLVGFDPDNYTRMFK